MTAAGRAARALGVSAAVLALLGPLLLPGEYPATLGISIATFAVLATGLNLVYGYTGLLSFAQVAFFGIGAYTSALLVVQRGWSLWVAFVAGGIVAALLGLVVAHASLRLSRHAFSIVSLSLALLCLIVARDWVSLTRGPMGLPGLPAPRLLVPGLGAVAVDRPGVFYGVVLAFAVVALAATHRLVHSRVGRALVAIKLNEALAQSHGVDPLRYRLLAIGVSALLTGMAGGLFVFHLTIVDPSIFDFYYTETMLIMVITGGPGSFWGVVGAAVVISALPDLLRFSTDLRMVLYGIVLIAAVLAFPGGVGGWIARRRLLRWRRALS
ncbi:MAG: branched-chain amino acid ABC transporter permease [Candidatus Rokubacteria bacterium]|nr:branched-chain amino acid ABC transporter permease [Candidatus Rokubacteria bacterium]